MTAINIQNFHKFYGSLEAVRGITFSVQKGEIFGVIGPDGAGKTTLLRAICTLLLPDQGSITINGLDVTKSVAEVRKILGYMPQRFSLYPDLTVHQNLQFFADLFEVPLKEKNQRLQQLYRFSRLEPFKNRKAANLSGGMKQKLALSCALIHRPEILVLDEPTTGVDPLSRQEFWEILHTIQKEGTTILISTAYMDEAEQCDRVVLFFRGKTVGLDTLENLKKKYPYRLYWLKAKNLRKLLNFFQTLENVRAIQLSGDTLHVGFDTVPAASDWQAWINATAGNLEEWESHPPSIEDVFLDLMRRPQ